MLKQSYFPPFFVSAPELLLSQPGTGAGWLQTRVYRDAISSREKEKAVLPNPTSSTSPGPSLVHPCPSSPSPYPLLSFISSFIMFKLARGRPVAAALRAATVSSYNCRALGPCPFTVDIY